MAQRKQISSPVFWLLCAFLSIVACGDERIDRSLDAQPMDLAFHRMDKKVFAKKDLKEKHQDLLQEFPSFYPFYFTEVLQLGNPSDSMAHEHLGRFVQEENWQFAQSQIDSVLLGLKGLEEEFAQAFSRYKQIYPDRKVPDIYIMNSGFNYGVYPYPAESILALGTEFYLGPDNLMTKRLPNEMFPAYIREQMRPEQILPNAIKGWLITTHHETEERNDLLGLMVTYGKIMYVLHLCLPDLPEHQYFAYTPSEMAWCERSEQEIWKTLVEHDLLFSTDRKILMDWVGRGPFTQGLSEESPAELAYFMGKQMVKDYMAEHPELPVSELASIPAEAILKEYSPG